MSVPITTIMSGASALNALSSEINPVGFNNIKEITFYIVFSAGVGAGAVQIEEAHTPGYTGTWAAIGAAVTFGDNAVKTVKASGVGMVARARISTLVTGGTVSVLVMGR